MHKNFKYFWKNTDQYNGFSLLAWNRFLPTSYFFLNVSDLTVQRLKLFKVVLCKAKLDNQVCLQKLYLWNQKCNETNYGYLYLSTVLYAWLRLPFSETSLHLGLSRLHSFSIPLFSFVSIISSNHVLGGWRTKLI